MPDVGGYTPAKKKRKNPIRERLSAEKPDLRNKPRVNEAELSGGKTQERPIVARIDYTKLLDGRPVGMYDIRQGDPADDSYSKYPKLHTDEQKRRVAQMRRGVDRGATPKTPTSETRNKRSEEAKKAKRRETLKRILSGRLSTAMKEQARSDTSRASRKAEKIVTGGEKPTTIGSYNLPEVKRRRRAVKNMTKVILRDMKRKKDERAKYMRHQSPNGYDGVVDNRGKK